jgi:hypothetical protein
MPDNAFSFSYIFAHVSVGTISSPSNCHPLLFLKFAVLCIFANFNKSLPFGINLQRKNIRP